MRPFLLALRNAVSLVRLYGGGHTLVAKAIERLEQASAALEGALSRAIYLLVHTFGRRVVLAADVPAELRPRLESFLSELY